MKNILLFGGSTETGKFISKKINYYFDNSKIYKFSSHKDKDDYIYLDLKLFSFPIEISIEEEILIISLAPIWLFIPYLEEILKSEKLNKKKILGIIAVSSTSAVTKKYSWNKFDKNLSKKLLFWEKKFLEIRDEYNINIDLIRPTLIYGNVGKNEDKNISILLKIMQKTLILPLPKETGLRQPIHYSQLAISILEIAKKTEKREIGYNSFINIFNIGGDEELTYKEILNRIKKSFPNSNKVNKCLIIEIPNRLFLALCFPLLIFSPKLYEAIERTIIDMNGFTKSYKITGKKRTNFPASSNF